MAGKFMSLKKLIIPVMTLIIMASQLTGCAVMDSREMVQMIDAGQSVTIEVAKPSYNVVIQGTQQEKMDWIQLDQLKTFNDGFRQGVDEVFNINIVTEKGINGKSGVLYVDESGDRNGNTTLEDALRNKVFVTKYWQDSKVKDKLGELVSDVYTDIDDNLMYQITGAINAYYNLLPDAKDPSAFNATQSLTREQFYALDFKAQGGVREIKTDQKFEEAIGGKTEYSKFAQEVDQFGFLSVANKSLDGSSFKGSISRAEAIYLIVNEHFAKELSKVDGSEKAFSDTKNGGDVAFLLEFKYKDDNGKIVGKDRWQSYTLATMLQNPDKGMQEEIYKAMVVAKQLNLISGDEARWDEPISKAEAIELVMNTHLAKNKLYGYLSEVEYGKINPDKFTTNGGVLGEDEGYKYGDGWQEVPESQVPVDPNKVLPSGLTLMEAKLLVESELATIKGNKAYTEKDIQEFAESIAQGLGTSMSEINRIVYAAPAPEPEKDSKATTPTKEKTTTTKEKTTTTKEKPKTTTPSSDSGIPASEDKNGNGIQDFLEGHEVTEGGGTVSDPDFHLE